MAPLHAIRKDGFKWIRAPRSELYDLRADPGELTNLHPSKDARFTGIAAELDQRAGRGAAGVGAARAAARENPMTRETLETLQSLGYLAPGAVRRSMAGVDPKDGIATYNRLEEARHAGQERDWPKAEAIAREILATLPDHVAARNVLGLAQVRQRKYDEARETYQRSLQTEPDQFRVHANLGSLALRARDLETSEKEFTLALGEESALRRSDAQSRLDRLAARRSRRRRAVVSPAPTRSIPGLPSTARRVGDLYYEEGDFKQALAHYERALKLSPRLFPALVQAGSSARRVGDPARAASYFEKAAALRADSWIPWYNLACLRATQGDVDAAFRALDESKKRGLRDQALLQQDPDLTPLRGDPRFAAFSLSADHAACRTPFYSGSKRGFDMFTFRRSQWSAVMLATSLLLPSSSAARAQAHGGEQARRSPRKPQQRASGAGRGARMADRCRGAAVSARADSEGAGRRRSRRRRSRTIFGVPADLAREDEQFFYIKLYKTAPAPVTKTPAPAPSPRRGRSRRHAPPKGATPAKGAAARPARKSAEPLPSASARLRWTAAGTGFADEGTVARRTRARGSHG